MKQAVEIRSLYEAQRTQRGVYLNECDEVRRMYYGEITVPLPELDANEKPAVANLLALGLDQIGMRVASVQPNVIAPALRPGIQISVSKAEDRKMAVEGWREMNHLQQKMRRRARFLVAYATAPVSIGPVSEDTSKRKMPFWRVRNPLCTFPAPMTDPDNIEPDWCIFHDRRPMSWVQQNYPDQFRMLHKGSNPNGFFEILEYVDSEETVLVAIGSVKDATENRGYGSAPKSDGITEQVVLDRIPNRIGICPVVVPGRITLDRPQSQFHQMIGMYQRAAKLDALNLLAVFRGIFSDEWVESIPNAPSKPKIIQYADGKAGIVGIIENGRHTQTMLNINQGAFQALDNLERSQRLTANIPSEFGGESPTNVRTARRGGMVLGAAMDMPIQEYQEIFERSFDAEIRRAIATMKVYHGNTPSMFFIPASGEISSDDYTPNVAFETDHVIARYALPGYDAEQASVAAGQKIGEGVWSAEKAMELDPTVDNVALERNRIAVEGLRRAQLAGLEAKAQNGELDEATMSRIIQKMADGKMTQEDAVLAVHNEMQQEQQAAQTGQEGAPPPEAGQPGMAATAAQGGAMPPPGSGVAGDTSVPQPPMGAQDLMQLLKTAHPPAQANAA